MMQDFLETKRSGSNVIRNENPMALHHSQVSTDPYKIFVLKRSLVGAGPKEIVCVLNAKVIEKNRESKKTVKEGCLSFPDRGDKKVQRFLDIKVRYEIPFIDKNKRVWFEVMIEPAKGYVAQIFQHEIEHASGRNIYM